MFHVEKMAPEDFAFAAKLSNTMDWNMTSGDFEFNVKLEPEGCFTLFDGTKRVGVATCINYGRVGWFGNLIVEPAYRHKGAGTQLVKHAVDYLINREVETIGLYAYPQLVSFYKKLGFKYNVNFQVMKATSLSSTGDAKMKAAEKRDMPALVDFDLLCFGASRRKLLEPILLDQDNLCHVSFENGKITGFAAAKVYGQMAEVGPLVCGRRHAHAAVDLLKSVLEKLQGLEVYLCVPSAENALINLTEKAGFTVEFRVARMFLGSVVAEDCVYVAESLERG